MLLRPAEFVGTQRYITHYITHRRKQKTGICIYNRCVALGNTFLHNVFFNIVNCIGTGKPPLMY